MHVSSRSIPGIILLAALLAPAGTGLRAQGRELHWPRFEVEARLDSAGLLHVKERQTVRFTGDWNGGERRFDLRSGQMFWILRINRIDATTGRPVLLHGDLDRVDGHAIEGSTVRWRSRLPSDPPFERTELTYEIETLLADFLVPDAADSTRVLLDHDFAFAERDGVIERFTLSLTVDPPWAPGTGFTGRYTANSLLPGEGFLVTVPLAWQGAGRAPGVVYGAGRPFRLALAIVMLLPLLPFAVRLFRREKALGRFEPLPAHATIDERWLRANVFSMQPEVVGHAWDDTTGQAEVAATLARLVQEKRLSSTVRRRGKSIFASDVLELTLETPRGRFTGHERALVDALFIGGDVTDTERVRKHYKATGFDPAALLRKPLAILVDSTPGAGTNLPKPSRWPSLVLCFVGMITFVVGIVTRPRDVPVAFATLGILFLCYFVAIIAAALWQRRVRALAAAALFWVLPLAASTTVLLALLLQGLYRAGPVLLAGLVLLWLGFTNSIFNQAMARQSMERIALRKRLAAAREFFRHELRKDAPALRDEWFAYLIAFGLGRHIDRWFRAFSPEVARSHAVMASSAGSSGSSGGSGGSSWTGFGGGGGFSGGGSSGSFAAAVGGMASSVPAPSSSSSGGGGGGGGSSGGGGGGGW